jgi:hypothetical protein
MRKITIKTKNRVETKLTIRLNEEVIGRAKRYARQHKVSLSKLIENYLLSVTRQKKEKALTTTPLVESLSGVMDLPEGYDYRKELR